MRKYLDWKVYVPREKAQPRSTLEELKGLADGSGVSYDIVFKANHHTAINMVLKPAFVKDKLKAFKKLGISLSACSSFASTGEATADGKTIVGRNTDYGGFTLWPKYQSLFFIQPENGYDHVKIGTAGVVIWNPGMNTEGIVVCPHYMPYDDCSADGWGITSFSDDILRKASNLNEAENIFHDNPRGISGGYVVVSGKEKDAFAAEVSTGSATIRHMENQKIVMTNMAVSEEKRKIDFTVFYNTVEHVPGRYRRLMQLQDIHYGKIDPELAAQFMGDHIQYSTGLETVSSCVGVADNVNSMVFSPEDLTLWVAAGPAPVCNNPFIGFSLMDELKGRDSVVTPAVLKGYVFQNPEKRRSLMKFMEAYSIFEEDPDNDKDRILKLLKEAWEIDPEESHFGRLIAKYYIHEGKYDQALKVIEDVLKQKQSFKETCHSNLIIATIYDLKGDRPRALSFYDKIEELTKEEPADNWFGKNKFLTAFVEKYKQQPFSKDNLQEESSVIEPIDSLME
ncbi:MAG: hypothetical protein GY866_29540 [Proteobacteria bacterium]|nr:hypothetical protein [Pseudomonadota bacterium]